MKKCYTEIMKNIKDIKNQLDSLESSEWTDSQVSFYEGEEPLPSTYDYETNKKKRIELSAEGRRLKFLLAKANTTTMVEGFDMTLSEALIYLAQLSNEYNRLKQLARRKQLDRNSGSLNGNAVPEFTKALYDVEVVKQDRDELNNTINRLQMAIDRTNLTNYLDV